MGKPKKLLEIGQQFGEWTVIGPNVSIKGNMSALCRCSCGAEMYMQGTRLRGGHSTSCRECAISTHGMTHSPTFATWASMRLRCNPKNADYYRDYAGRGIKICPEWADFSRFLADMGERPGGMTIDRIDVNGDYCKENCRWATAKDQAENRRNTIWVEYKGQKYTIPQLSRLLGINHHTIRNRIRKGTQLDAPVTKNQ